MTDTTKTAEATETRATWYVKLAKALHEITRAANSRRSNESALRQFGITMTDPSTDPNADANAPQFVVPAESPDTYIGGGITLADLSPEAVAKREAKLLRELKQEAYVWLQEQVNYGYMPEDAVIRQLGTLGLPAPVKYTVASVEFYDPTVHKVVTKSLRIPGKHVTADEIKATLAPHVGMPAGNAAMVAAFPEQADQFSNGLSVYADRGTTWPESSTIK